MKARSLLIALVLVAIAAPIPAVAEFAGEGIWPAPGGGTGGSFTAATASSINTGTANDEAMTPLGAQTSKYNTRIVALGSGPHDATVIAGDSQSCWAAPVAGTLLAVKGHVFTASTSGNPTFMVHKKLLANDSLVDMLSTALTIDANERDSSTAETAAVVSTTEGVADFVAGDELCLDIDTAGTGTKGDVVYLIIRLANPGP
jgi:hypothetical protein